MKSLLNNQTASKKNAYNTVKIGQCVQIPHLPIEHSVTPWLLASTCFYWNHKCFTWYEVRSSRSSGIDHQYTTLMNPNQSVALSSFVGWLVRRSLVAANRTSVPLAMVSILLTWSGWRNIQWELPFVTNTLHWAMCTIPHLTLKINCYSSYNKHLHCMNY